MTAHQQAKSVPDYSFSPVDRAARTASRPRARVMTRSTIDRLIVNSSCEERTHHWRRDHTTRLFDLVPGRRASAAGPSFSRC